MIMINVQLAETDRFYDCKVDETAPIRLMAEELADLVVKQEHFPPEAVGERDGFFVYRKDTMELLSPDSCLRDCGIRPGDTLFLI